MLPKRIWRQSLATILLVWLMASEVGFSTQSANVNKTVPSEAKLYWALDKLLEQKQTKKTKQFVQEDEETARRLLTNLLFVELDFSLELEDAEFLSPRMGEILTLLGSVADEQLKRLMTLTGSVQQGSNPFRNESGKLAEALSAFVDAARAEGPDEQTSLWQSALQKCRELGLGLGELICLHWLGKIERDRGNLPPSLAHLLKAKELTDHWNYTTRLPAILNALGVTSYRLGLLETAYRQLLSALELARQQGKERLQGMILTNLSAVAIQMSSFRWAADFLQQALDFGQTVARLTNVGTIHTYLRDYETALQAFNEALELAEKQGDLRRQISLWNNIGAVYWLQGNYEQALYCLQRALKIAEQTQDPLRTVPLHLTLGLIYTDTGDFESAEKHLSELLRLSRQIGDRLSEVGALIRLGHLRNYQRRWDEAEEFLNQAVRIAEQVNHQPTAALALLNLGMAHGEKGDHSRAAIIFSESLRIWQNLGDIWGQSWAWKNLGEAHEKLGMQQSGQERNRLWLQALDAYWQSVRLMEKVRERAGGETMGAYFAQSASEPFYRLANLLALMGRNEEAFEIVERMKARSLLELIQMAGLLEKAQISGQEGGEYDALKRRIAQLEEQLARLLTEPSPDLNRISQLRQELSDTRNEFERLRDFQRLQRWKLLPVSKRQIAFNAWQQLKLPEDTAVLAYIVTENRTWLFVLSRSGGSWQIQSLNLEVTQKQLEEDIAWLRERIERRLSVGATLHRLYIALFAPAEKVLKGKRKLVIIPEGPLYTLPFQVLQNEDGTYLIERFTIAYAPSLTTLWSIQHRSLYDNSVAAKTSRQKSKSPEFRHPNAKADKLLWTGLGVSTFDGKLEPLPYAREEVKQIASLLKQARPKMPIRFAIDINATKTAAVQALKESRWVHFATHAILEPKRPLYSRLIFAVGKEQDKNLRAFEVMDLGQNSCEMAVLSACETGLGKVLQGEGLLGLLWTFMATGTKTIVVSQWRVNDLSTAKLMREYYSNLLKGLQPAEAMRRAQMNLLSQRRFYHPYYWAAFVVWGKGF